MGKTQTEFPDYKGMKYIIYSYSTEMVMAFFLIIGFVLGLLWVNYGLPVPKPLQKKKDNSKGNKTTSEFTQGNDDEDNISVGDRIKNTWSNIFQ